MSLLLRENFDSSYVNSGLKLFKFSLTHIINLNFKIDGDVQN